MREMALSRGVLLALAVVAGVFGDGGGGGGGRRQGAMMEYARGEVGCAVRSTCVAQKVCPCNIGTPGCEPGGERCPFPGDGAPCVDMLGAPPSKV